MEYDFKNVTLDHLSLAYVEKGRGTPVILVHGAGPTDLHTWGNQIEPFAKHYRVIAYSQRYHYPNAWIGDGSDIVSTRSNARDLAHLVERLNLGRVHLVGSSNGADIALRLAVERPELVRSLVLGEPGLPTWLTSLPGGPELFAEFSGSLIPAKKAVARGDLEQGLALFLEGVLGAGRLHQLPGSVQERLKANVRLIGYEPTEIEEYPPDITRSEAASLQMPTLILTGDQSPEMLLLVSEELARFVPNNRQEEIQGASHILHVMNPADYNAAVLNFLSGQVG